MIAAPAYGGVAPTRRVRVDAWSNWWQLEPRQTWSFTLVELACVRIADAATVEIDLGVCGLHVCVRVITDVARHRAWLAQGTPGIGWG